VYGEVLPTLGIAVVVGIPSKAPQDPLFPQQAAATLQAALSHVRCGVEYLRVHSYQHHSACTQHYLVSVVTRVVVWAVHQNLSRVPCTL
jgi:hypothetical protein